MRQDEPSAAEAASRPPALLGQVNDELEPGSLRDEVASPKRPCTHTVYTIWVQGPLGVSLPAGQGGARPEGPRTPRGPGTCQRALRALTLRERPAMGPGCLGTELLGVIYYKPALCADAYTIITI